MFGCGYRAELMSRGTSKFNESISTTTGARSPGIALMYFTTSRTIEEVVSITEGAESCSADDTRSSRKPNSGAGNGTAMNPACNAPRNATM